MTKSILVNAVGLLCAYLFSGVAHASGIEFSDVTQGSGISHRGETWGVSWGDYNADGRPDVWVSNHQTYPGLYRNNGDGTFTDVARQLLGGINDKADTHGAAWGDFDNSGYQSLIEVSGAGSGGGRDCANPLPNWFNHFYIFSETGGTDIAAERGVQYACGRGRTPHWIEGNKDGALDLFIATETTDGSFPSTLFTQLNNYFHNSGVDAGLLTHGVGRSNYSQLSDLNGDGRLDLMVSGFFSFPGTVLDIGTWPYTKITPSLAMSSVSLVHDSALADFTGDLRPDAFLAVKKGDNETDVVLLNNNTVAGYFPTKDPEIGFDFSSSGDLTFKFTRNSAKISVNEIFVGTDGHHPPTMPFTLSVSDAANWITNGQLNNTASGFLIGFDTTSGKWMVRSRGLAIGKAENQLLPNVLIVESSTAKVTGLQSIGFQPYAATLKNRFFVNQGGKLVDKSSTSGFTVPTSCASVGTGDFDNDMDLDIYLVCRGQILNYPNILYENNGTGLFSTVPLAGGAEASMEGRGESVAVADYDGDGRLDLFVTNGMWPPPFLDGPDQIFRNTTQNGNHWLEIDLIGVKSNRDGVGASVFVTAGGKTQLREAGGGMHLFSQDHQRLHFGLAANQRVEKIKVVWPSGVVQEVSDMPADMILQVQESVGSYVKGKPSYVPGAKEGVFVWADSFDGPMHVRVSGSGNETNFNVKLLADKPFVSNTPIKLDGDDVYAVSEFGLMLSAVIANGEDGFDFSPAPNARVLLAADRLGIPNPRMMHFGSASGLISPVGWITDLASLQAPMPEVLTGKGLGLYVGEGVGGGLEAHINGAGSWHFGNLSVLTSTAMPAPTPVNTEAGDSFKLWDNGFSLVGQVTSDLDGVAFLPASDSMVGIAYNQDKLFQERALKTGNVIGQANAYWLPTPNPYGPLYFNPAVDAGVMLWKDQGGAWHLRLSAGGTALNVTGKLVSDSGFTSVTADGIEANDVLNTSNPNEIVFGLNVMNSGTDGFDFRIPSGANVTLQLDPLPVGDVKSLVKVGSMKWPVNALPLKLSGWN
jgi:hypothetical protein